ncbi:MAG: hypothetical protein KGJ93_04570 [Patescibacteria group bacterium]|nr:hypothetical protein [Patescibacteria group bacterium]
MEGQNLAASAGSPDQAAVSVSYFKNVPVGYLLTLAWFSYTALSAAAALSAIFYLWPILVNGNIYQYVFSTPAILLPVLPVLAGFVSIAVWIGLVKQRAWTRIVAVVWYLLALPFFVFILYSIIAGGAMSGLGGFFLSIFSSSVITLVIHTAALYYVLARVKYV